MPPPGTGASDLTFPHIPNLTMATASVLFPIHSLNDNTVSGHDGRLRESLGISADGSEKAFNSEDVEAFMARALPALYRNVRQVMDNIHWSFTAVDPSGGGASAFSIATITQDPKGFLHVRSAPCPPLSPFSPPLAPRAAPPRDRDRPSHMVHTMKTEDEHVRGLGHVGEEGGMEGGEAPSRSGLSRGLVPPRKVRCDGGFPKEEEQQPGPEARARAPPAPAVYEPALPHSMTASSAAGESPILLFIVSMHMPMHSLKSRTLVPRALAPF